MHALMTKSLAQIVNSNHRAAAVFEKYQLDFCCKGKRSLQQACTESAVAVETILSELEETAQNNSDKVVINYTNLSLSQLVDIILAKHHTYVKKEMPVIAQYLQKVASKHGDRHPEMRKVFELFMAVKEEMELHMQKEEGVLFPRIKELEKQILSGSKVQLNITYLKSPISLMEQEHEHAGSAMAEIRQLTGNYKLPDDACTTYRLSFAALEAFELDLHQHVHLENNILFPKALRLFKEQEIISLN
ncbi:MAG: iron-sulfur cluster repair di-iron protein [Chitinophagaceae bacterium]|nr:iron-sulfur cluster repair di-iron protein [Chitinophagaceae bacterium]